MAAGDIIILDSETTGLDPEIHTPFEVSWVKWDPEGRMVPKTFYLAVGAFHLIHADPRALAVNGYTMEELENIWKKYDGNAVTEFLEAVEGSTIMGANVRFDALMLTTALSIPEPWHHRLFDIEAYVAGTFGLDHIPGNSETRRLIIEVEENRWSPTTPDHTSANDVRTVRDVFAWCRWYSDSSLSGPWGVNSNPMEWHPSNMGLG